MGFRLALQRPLALVAATVALSAAAVAQAPTLNTISDSFRELARRVNPSVVKVVATGFRALNEDDETAEPGVVTRQQSSGSGVIIDADGLILTNAHVVISARSIQVTLTTARDDTRRSAVRPAGRLLSAELVGFDLETDLAVIRVPRKNLPALTLGDSDLIEQGQFVLACGSPLGLDNSVSVGVVSSTARQLKADDSMIYIQTDAPINPGSSGGPLVDTEGRVIGINTLILSQGGGNEGLGFAVPSNIVASVVEQIRKHGRVIRGEVGLTVQSIDPNLAASWKLAQDWGVVVADVDDGSPAAAAGVEPGDIIRSLNDKVMENARQFNVNVYQPTIGSEIRLELLRDRKRIATTLRVQERKPEPERISALATRDENLIPELGIFALDLTAELRDQLGATRRDTGVLVASRLDDSTLAEDGLKAGDVIYAANREQIGSTARLRMLLNTLKPGDPVGLQIERQGRLRFLAFQKP